MKTDEQLNDLARKSSAGIFTSTNAAADYETGFYYGYRAAEQAQQWLPVAERLPDKHARVQILVWTKGLTEPDVLQGSWEGNRWRIYGGETAEKVTHWQPLPSPPKTETGL